VFVRGLSVTQSWEKLKAALKEEFNMKVSSADIHQKLAKRKMKKDESLQEYYLSMRELASQGNVDPESVIQYVIDGIPDSSSKMLYGARDYNEFRTRLRTYEKLQARGATTGKGNLRRESTGKPIGDDAKSSKGDQKGDQKKLARATYRCYNCGESGHKSNLCKFKERGKKCFKCNNFGHESKSCPGTDKSDSGSIQVTTNALVKPINASRMFKEVVIEGKKFYALLDTGSHLSLMREDIFVSIDASRLGESEVLVTGIAQGQIRTLGHYQTIVTVDDFKFPLTFHVIPSKALDIAIILGTILLINPR